MVVEIRRHTSQPQKPHSASRCAAVVVVGLGAEDILGPWVGGFCVEKQPDTCGSVGHAVNRPGFIHANLGSCSNLRQSC